MMDGVHHCNTSYPLHNAVRCGTLEECQRLIGAGMNVNLTDNKRRTPLHIAAWKGDARLVKLLLRSKCCPVDKALDGFTALHFAAMSGSAESCDLLISKQRSLLKDRVSKGNKTALHLAITKGNLDVVEKLLELGADVTAKQGNGKNVLELATTDAMYQVLKKKWEESVEKLNKRGSFAGKEAMSEVPLRGEQEEVDTKSFTTTVLPPDNDSLHVSDKYSDGELAANVNCVAAASVVESLSSVAPSDMSAAMINVPALPVVNRKKRKVIVAHLEFDEEEDFF